MRLRLGRERREEYLVTSFRTFQKIPHLVGSAVLVRRISTPASQSAAIRSYCSPLHLARSSTTTKDHGGGQSEGGE